VKGDDIARSQRHDYEQYAGETLLEGDVPLTNRDMPFA
jgi:hypothetical protein